MAPKQKPPDGRARRMTAKDRDVIVRWLRYHEAVWQRSLACDIPPEIATHAAVTASRLRAHHILSFISTSLWQLDPALRQIHKARTRQGMAPGGEPCPK